MEQILAILDGEERYAARLQHFLNHQTALGMRAAAFTSVQNFEQYMEQHPVSLLLCEESLYYEMEQLPKCRTVLLSERIRVREGESPPLILKFQSAEEILKELMELFQQVPAKDAAAEPHPAAKLLTFCSVTRAEKASELALQYARKKSKQEKVFYLSLDPFYQPEGTECISALSAAIYYIKQGSEIFREKFNQFVVKKEKMECLYGVSCWTELLECSAGETAELLKEIAVITAADTIIADAGGFTEAAAGCMAVSDQIVFVKGNSKREEKREQLFLEQAQKWDTQMQQRTKQLPALSVEEMLAQLTRILREE